MSWITDKRMSFGTWLELMYEKKVSLCLLLDVENSLYRYHFSRQACCPQICSDTEVSCTMFVGQMLRSAEKDFQLLSPLKSAEI